LEKGDGKNIDTPGLMCHLTGLVNGVEFVQNDGHLRPVPRLALDTPFPECHEPWVQVSFIHTYKNKSFIHFIQKNNFTLTRQHFN
jgi:hypothetical protein